MSPTRVPDRLVITDWVAPESVPESLRAAAERASVGLAGTFELAWEYDAPPMTLKFANVVGEDALAAVVARLAAHGEHGDFLIEDRRARPGAWHGLRAGEVRP